MMRYSKKLLILSICLVVDLCLILGLCIFDVVQMIQISKNAILLSSGFVSLNIVLIALLGINIVSIITYLVVYKIKERKYESKKN